MDDALTAETELPQSHALIVDVPLESDAEIDFRFIELLFFAYRQFTADADEILAEYGFGRAHHRVLHFVNRAPGMTIADLLELLQITKQSLSRVLRHLIDEGFVAQTPGSEDRRQRRLYPTASGRALTLELSRAQVRRIADARGAMGPEETQALAQFLYRMGGKAGSARDWMLRHGEAEKDET